MLLILTLIEFTLVHIRVTWSGNRNLQLMKRSRRTTPPLHFFVSIKKINGVQQTKQHTKTSTHEINHYSRLYRELLTVIVTVNVWCLHNKAYNEINCFHKAIAQNLTLVKVILHFIFFFETFKAKKKKIKLPLLFNLVGLKNFVEKYPR